MSVRAIRIFRPLVVISRFSGTPADGHGQHQYAGYISPIAVEAAADENQCKDSNLPTWQVLKYYVGQGFRDNSEPTLKINTGKYDFLLGRSVLRNRRRRSQSAQDTGTRRFGIKRRQIFGFEFGLKRKCRKLRMRKVFLMELILRS